jgi:acetolactate synthase I/II/III large subunit
MNRLSGAEAFVRMLQRHGVRHVFGLCGDTSLPLYDALYRLDHGITHVLTRDERSAAYMAYAYARVTGRVGVCEGPSGGGATYILPGVVEANESSIPVLAVTTDIAVGARGRYVLTELDQQALFRPLTKSTRVIDRADQIPGAVRAAFRRMTSGRPGAAHLGLPFDVQRDPVHEAAVHADATLATYPARRAAPDPAAVEAAAKAILSAERPLLLCGGGPVIAGAQAELGALADLLDAPVATAISGQGSIAEDHPLALGVVGSNGGTAETRAVVDQADLVVCRRLPRRLGYHRALAVSGAGQGARGAHRRRSDGHWGQLPDRGRPRRRCHARACGAAGRSRASARADRPGDRARSRRACQGGEVRPVPGAGLLR